MKDSFYELIHIKQNQNKSYRQFSTLDDAFWFLDDMLLKLIIRNNKCKINFKIRVKIENIGLFVYIHTYIFDSIIVNDYWRLVRKEFNPEYYPLTNRFYSPSFFTLSLMGDTN